MKKPARLVLVRTAKEFRALARTVRLRSFRHAVSSRWAASGRPSRPSAVAALARTSSSGSRCNAFSSAGRAAGSRRSPRVVTVAGRSCVADGLFGWCRVHRRWPGSGTGGRVGEWEMESRSWRTEGNRENEAGESRNSPPQKLFTRPASGSRTWFFVPVVLFWHGVLESGLNSAVPGELLFAPDSWASGYASVNG